jgi:hypothetical protein
MCNRTREYRSEQLLSMIAFTAIEFVLLHSIVTSESSTHGFRVIQLASESCNYLASQGILVSFLCFPCTSSWNGLRLL